MRKIIYVVLAIVFLLFIFERRETLVNVFADLFDSTTTTEPLRSDQTPASSDWSENPMKITTQLERAKEERYEEDMKGVPVKETEEVYLMPGAQ